MTDRKEIVFEGNTEEELGFLVMASAGDTIVVPTEALRESGERTARRSGVYGVTFKVAGKETDA